MIEIIICALATYGICTLVSEYDGAFDVFSKLRAKIAAFRCIPCASVWIAAPLAFFLGIGLLGYLAAIGLVLFMHRVDL